MAKIWRTLGRPLSEGLRRLVSKPAPSAGVPQWSEPWQPCVYCAEPASSQDFAPPKAVFRRHVPRLTAIPTCSACKTKFSSMDETFWKGIVGGRRIDRILAAPILERVIRGLIYVELKIPLPLDISVAALRAR